MGRGRWVVVGGASGYAAAALYALAARLYVFEGAVRGYIGFSGYHIVFLGETLRVPALDYAVLVSTTALLVTGIASMGMAVATAIYGYADIHRSAIVFVPAAATLLRLSAETAARVASKLSYHAHATSAGIVIPPHYTLHYSIYPLIAVAAAGGFYIASAIYEALS